MSTINAFKTHVAAAGKTQRERIEKIRSKAEAEVKDLEVVLGPIDGIDRLDPAQATLKIAALDHPGGNGMCEAVLGGTFEIEEFIDTVGDVAAFRQLLKAAQDSMEEQLVSMRDPALLQVLEGSIPLSLQFTPPEQRLAAEIVRDHAASLIELLLANLAVAANATTARERTVGMEQVVRVGHEYDSEKKEFLPMIEGFVRP